MFNSKNWILLKELVKTDFKLRYQGSILGYLWAVLRPLLMFAILYIVFVKFLRFGDTIPHYAVYLLIGIVLWNFFSESTSQGIQSIVSRGDLLRKINFPKLIVVISATATALINMLINLAVVVIFALFDGVSFTPLVLLLPLVILELYVFSLSISLFLGAINVKYRDISSIWDVIMQAMFYAVPIIYPLSMVVDISAAAAKIILLNPIAQAIQDARYLLVTQDTIITWTFINQWHIKILSPLIVIVFFVIALKFFNSRSKKFAEIY
jgi:ABC-2 type transport system permease protein